MIKLVKLKLKNWGIFKGEVVLDFSDKDVVGILAEYKSDKKRSNRSGKSLLLEAIRYNLIGTTRSKKEINLIHEGEKVMIVEGTYVDSTAPDKPIVIRRGRDHKNKGMLNLNYIEKTTEAQPAINELFEINSEDFDLTSFFKQKDINGFMDKSPTEKTNYLMKWLDNEHWKDKETKVKDDIKVIKDFLKENSIIKTALEESLEVGEEIEVEISTMNSGIENLGLSVTNMRDKRIEVKGDIKQVTDDKEELDNKISKLTREINRAKQAHTIVIDSAEELQTAKLSLKTLKEIERPKGDWNKLQEKIINLRNDNRDIIKKIASHKGECGVCPITNEACDLIQYSEKDIKRFTANKEQNSDKITTCAQQIKDIEEDQKNEKRIDKCKHRIGQLKLEISNNSLDVDIKSLRKKLGKLNDTTKLDPRDLTNQLSDLDKKIEDTDEEIKRRQKKVGALEHRIKTADEALQKIDDVNARSKKLNRRLEDLNYVAMMFGKNGIPADEIENSFTEIQDDINYILKELDCGLTVSFSPDKELSKKEAMCHCGWAYPKGFRGIECEECNSPRLNQRKDEISLKILENGHEKDFDLDSGGGKTIISYAVRIALTMLKRRQNKCRLNMLFLDEVDSALDSHLASSITDSITKVLTKKLGYDQIFMVSHKEEIKEAVPTILKVTRFEKHSEAAFL